MRLIYGGVPYNTLKVKHYEVDTNICDMEPSDLQAGKTAVAKGRMITGTGKSFEFARYGGFKTNLPIIIPGMINVIEIASVTHPIKTTISLSEMKNIDFSIPQVIGYVVVENTEIPITLTINNGMLTFTCDQSLTLQFFFGKDNYV